VDVADVDVVEGGGGPGFLDETMAGFGISRAVGRQELERDDPPEAQVFGFVDDPHATRPISRSTRNLPR